MFPKYALLCKIFEIVLNSIEFQLRHRSGSKNIIGLKREIPITKEIFTKEPTSNNAHPVKERLEGKDFDGSSDGGADMKIPHANKFRNWRSSEDGSRGAPPAPHGPRLQ